MSVGAHTTAPPALSRPQAVSRARMLTWLTMTWNVIEGVVATVAGVIAGSASLIGFGVDSVIEVSSAGIVAWRLGNERHQVCQQDTDRLATRLIAGSLALLATWVAYEAVSDLVLGARPQASPVGIGIAALSLVVMPLLARAKRRLAPILGSRAVEADAAQTNICAWLSAVLLVGLGANALFGWWWADPLSGVGIAVLAAVEARRTWTADSLEDTCCG